MAENLKDVKVTKEELEQATRYLKELATLRGISVKELKLSREDIKAMAKEIIDGTYKKDKELIKDVTSLLKESLQEQKQLKQEQQKQNQSFLSRIGFKKDMSRDDISSQYRARQMAGGIESLLEGRLSSGLRQLASTVPQLANFMGTGLYAAMSALAQATIRAVDGLSRLQVASKRLSGGMDVSGNKFSRAADTYALSIMYGQNQEDFDKYMMSNIGYGRKKSLWSDRRFTEAYMFTRAGMEQIGVDPSKANSLISQQLSLGFSTDTIKKFNYRLLEVTKTLDTLSADQFISNYEELNKTLIANNINGIASAKMFAQFQDALNKGTLATQDFTRGLTSRRQSSTATLAGVGTMLAERGLGGKELQEAYKAGDTIKIAGIMRRGGNEITRGIEQLERNFANDLSQQLGTTDLKELLALQSDTSWGQLGANLKNLEVQKTIAAGGTMAIGLESLKKPLTKEEQEAMQTAEKDLIDETVKLKGSFEALGQFIKYELLNVLADSEKGPTSFIQNPLVQRVGGSLPIIGLPIQGINLLLKFVPQNQTSTE